jgi:tRNA(Ile)-lysidine synthase
MPPIVLSDVFVPGEHVLCAVSGGADSVALLLLLAQAAREGRLRVTAAHFDHGIRRESADEAAFVRALCARLGVRLIEGAGDVPRRALDLRQGMETAARDARRAFLEEARRAAGADSIATAHHMDDQAETVLMHLLRGCGSSGAAGMRPRNGAWVRPLLGWRKEDLVGFLEERKEIWQTDSSNFVPDNPRNRLRLEILPALEQMYPGAVRAIGRYAAIAAEESDCLEELAGSFLEKHGIFIDPWLSAIKVVPAHRALVKRAVRRLEPSLDYDMTERISDLYFSESGRFSAAGVLAERCKRRLYLMRTGWRPEDVLGELRSVPCKSAPVMENGFRQVLDAAAVQGARLRTRREGDWISPLGMRGKKSLSDYLTDRKIDRPLRDRLPLLAAGAEVLWVVGVGISNRAALGARCNAVELTYLPKQWRNGPHDERSQSDPF